MVVSRSLGLGAAIAIVTVTMGVTQGYLTAHGHVAPVSKAGTPTSRSGVVATQVPSSASGDPPVRLLRPTTMQGVWLENRMPLVVVLHPNGSTPESLAAAFQDLAQRMKTVTALPQGPLPTGTGFTWGSTDQAEAGALRAVERAREVAVIDPDRMVLVGFEKSATLACSVGLRQADQFSGVVAVAPALEDPPALLFPRPKRMPRVAILCTDRDAHGCQRTREHLESVGVPVYLRMLDAEHARAGLVRLREALDLVLSKQVDRARLP